MQKVQLSTLFEGALKRNIEKGYFEKECKNEWEKRWGLPFPKIRSAKGVINFGEW